MNREHLHGAICLVIGLVTVVVQVVKMRGLGPDPVALFGVGVGLALMILGNHWMKVGKRIDAAR